MLPGVQAENAKPLLMYAGGSWISESAKATQFKHKPVFFIFRILKTSTVNTDVFGAWETKNHGI